VLFFDPKRIEMESNKDAALDFYEIGKRAYQIKDYEKALKYYEKSKRFKNYNN
jgi:hypothetical protein